MKLNNRRLPLSLALVLIVLGGLVACNSGTNTTTTESPSPTETTAVSPSPTETTTTTTTSTTEEENSDPISAGLTGGDRANTDPLELLQSQQLKDELKLTDEQVTKIKEISDKFRQDLGATITGLKLNELKPEEQSAKLQEVSGDIKTKIETTRQEIGSVLTPEQVTRFKGISLQLYGFGALNSGDFRDDLKYTEEQQKQLDELETQLSQNIRANWTIPDSTDPAERQKAIDENSKRIDKLIKESNDAALAVLTAEQKQTLESLKGAEFKLNTAELQPQ